MNSHPPRISIQPWLSTDAEAASQAVPVPACGEGNSGPLCSSMFIPLMELSCACAGVNKVPTSTAQAMIGPTAFLNTKPRSLRKGDSHGGERLHYGRIPARNLNTIGGGIPESPKFP